MCSGFTAFFRVSLLQKFLCSALGGEREFLCCKLSSAGVQFTLHVKENSRDLYSGLFRVSIFVWSFSN